MVKQVNKMTGRRVFAKILALAAAVALALPSFAEAVYADGEALASPAPETANDSETAQDRVITGFAEFDIEGHYLTVDRENRPSTADLTAMMPETLDVYVNGAADPESAPVAWYCIEGNYEESESYYVQFSPDFGEAYAIDPVLDIWVDAPYIGVFLNDGGLKDSAEDGSISDDILNGAATTYTNAPCEPKIFSYLTKTLGHNKAAAVGIMANIYCESSFFPNNLQNTGNKALNMTDEQYTAAVDNGSYTNFVYDKYGYGLIQWTWWSRKQNLLNFARQRKSGISDYAMQLDFMTTELNAGYANLRQILSKAPLSEEGAYNAAYYWCTDFERPSNTQARAVERGNLAKKLWPIYKDQGVTYKTKYERISGDSRYMTALAAADKLIKKRQIDAFDAIVLASSATYPDALSGAALAGKTGAPILLISADGKGAGSEWTMTYIQKRLVPGGTIYILGGETAIGTEVETTLLARGYDVKRLGGASRYETNLLIVGELEVETGSDVYIATGKNFADALSASGASAKTRSPVILTGGELTEDALAAIAAIEPGTIYIIGGSAAVPAAVEEQLKDYPSVRRIQGDSRYTTSVEVAKALSDSGTKEAVIATGKNFPDGLVAGLIAAEIDAPILLVSDSGYAPAAKYAASKGIDYYYVMGGTAAVSDRAVTGLMR